MPQQSADSFRLETLLRQLQRLVETVTSLKASVERQAEGAAAQLRMHAEQEADISRLEGTAGQLSERVARLEASVESLRELCARVLGGRT